MAPATDAPSAPPTTPAQFSVLISDYKMNTDGSMTVRGPVTTESIDAVNDIVDAEWAAKALDTWLNGRNGGNLRGQHQESWPVGRGLQVEREGSTHILEASIVDPLAQTLVKARVLKAFSVGIVGTKRIWESVQKAWRVVGGALEEVSICDVPCNADTEFMVAKAEVKGGELKSLDLFSRIDPKVLGEVLTPDELIALAQKFSLDTNSPLVREALAASALKADDANSDDDAADCDTCKGSGKIRGGKGKCPDCDGSGKEPKKSKKSTETKVDAVPEDAKTDDVKAEPVDGAAATETAGAEATAPAEVPAAETAAEAPDDTKAVVEPEVPEDVTKAIDETLARLHTATCSLYTTEQVQKMDPGEWSARLGIGDLETKFQEHTALVGTPELNVKALTELTGVVGKLAGPTLVSRFVPAAILDEAHTAMVAEQRAQKGVAQAIGATAGAVPARVFYTNQAAARHADQFKAIHDAVVGLRPDVCPSPELAAAATPQAPSMMNTDGSPVSVNGSVSSATNKSAPLLDAGAAVAAGATANPVVDPPAVADAAIATPAPAGTEAVKAEDEAPAVEAPVAPAPVAAAPAAEAPKAQPEVDINAVIAEMANAFQARADERFAAFKAENDLNVKALKAQIEALETRPNPNEAVLRKALMSFAPGQVVVDETEAAKQLAVMRQFAEDGSDPDRQQQAAAWLAKHSN